VSTAAEILDHALALPPNERAGIVRSLLHSLPSAPVVYQNEQELAAELSRRMERIESGAEETFDADDTLRRAREALERSRG
jgi:putative addiction module component (TIGR02574 family)